MIFNKLFYQDNRRQREEVSNLKKEVIESFQEYRIAWNVNANQINDVIRRVDDTAYAGLTLPTLEKNIQLNTVTDCVDEINTAIADAEAKLDRLVEDDSKPKLISVEWQGKKRTIDRVGVSIAQKVGKVISSLFTIIAALASVLFMIYLSCIAAGFFLLITFFLLPKEEVMEVIYRGVVMGLVSGSIVFVTLDLFFSAIHGTIERKGLNKAIDELTKLKGSMGLAMPNAIVILSSIASSLMEKFDHGDVIHDGSPSLVLEDEKVLE